MNKEWYSAAELAGLSGMPGTDRAVQLRAKREEWKWQKRSGKGGGREYHLTSLPTETQATLLVGNASSEPGPSSTPHPANLTDAGPTPAPVFFTYDRESLWAHFDRKPQAQKDKAARKLEILHATLTLREHGAKLGEAFRAVAAEYGESARTVAGWYQGNGGKPGVKQYHRQDWLAALAPGYTGRTAEAEIATQAWEFFKAHHLTRRQPTVSDSYRRTAEAAQAHGWSWPAERTIARKIERDISRPTYVMLRQGPQALRQLLPWQRRDTSVFAPGEAVTGDGLKFDKLWIDWGDEILNTTTGWFWQDIYSNKILAYRIAKTESTDVFRLATYDLTAICLPAYVQIDNTRVAANKAMTAGAKGRHRFKDHPDDALGLLLQLGMEPHFTDPDHTRSNPGVKPIERAFGTGGIHDAVACHPKFIERGFSKKTAIKVDEFQAIVAEEVKRHNSREKRRTPLCAGVKSFDQAFDEAFASATVRRATEAQRRLLLLMPEVVKATTAKGEVRLSAGSGPMGKPRYWSDELIEFAGHKVVAYYDPENLAADVAVYSLDGRHICQAQRLDDVGFNDVAAAKEWRKNGQRRMKALKIAAKAENRMDDIASQYPAPDDVAIPAPGVVMGNFAQKKQITEGGKIENRATAQPDEMDDNLSAAIHNLAAQRKAEKGDEEEFNWGFKTP